MTAPGQGQHDSPRPRGARGPEAFVVSRFARLARVHAFAVAGDTLIAIALAGSIFFSVDADAARGRTALYLVLTMAPFAIVSPLIGPAIDRAQGGRRLMVMLTAASRAVIVLLMAQYLDSLFLFPLAFIALALGKGYHVAKSSLVPSLVSREAVLVEANSKLVLISGIAGAVAGIPGALLSLVGSEAVLVLAALVFGIATFLSLRIPSEAIAAEPIGPEERSELRSAGIFLAASAMALLRGLVGFMIFLVAFWLKESDASKVWYGVILVASMVGNFLGALIATRLRRSVREEHLLTAVMALTGATVLMAAIVGGLWMASLFALVLGFSASLGKLAFDAIVQRDAPDANQGRTFARFETRFQLVWVIGALIPVLVPTSILPIRLAFLLLAAAAAFGVLTYIGGRRATVRGEATPTDRMKAKVLNDQNKERAREALRSVGWRRRAGGRHGDAPPSGASTREPPAPEAPSERSRPVRAHPRHPPTGRGGQGRLFDE